MRSDQHFFLHECPDTGRVFLCEAGVDDNLAEIHDVQRWRRYNAWCTDAAIDIEQRTDSGTLPPRRPADWARPEGTS